ncbi:MAG: chemotaxis protein CheV [Lachnospiraceae bacterium]|nr:chemotaxis protein CheV [Lachnospiraceae bacterium]
MESKILMESGTNELEVLEFTIAGNSYGINVAKIREIINYQPVTPIPNAHPSIEGIFMPRDTMITAVDLANCLQLGEVKNGGLFIITNFNKLDVAFHVENVIGIHRVSWTQIMKPEATLSNSQEGISTGIVNINGKLIVILDFEKIVSDINPETSIKMSEIEQLGERNRNNIPIVLAEDSALLNKLVRDALNKAGYNNVLSCVDGQEAWDVITDAQKKGMLDETCKLVITDIEMPRMDGLRLLKLIKDDDKLNHLPVVIFSSLINEEMRRKGESLGADAQLSKPEIGNLVMEVDALVNR